MLFFICKSPKYFLPSFKSISILVQEIYIELLLKRKIDFQYGRYGGHLGFTIRTILSFFNLQVAPILPIKFLVNWSFGSGDEAQYRFSR